MTGSPSVNAVFTRFLSIKNIFFSLMMGFLLLAVCAPASAQWRLSPSDQSRFDSYYSRWMDYQQRNDRDQARSMEERMRDIYAHYNIPPNTPFWRVATNGGEGHGHHRWQLSASDQARFDSYFSRWQEYRRTNNRDQVRSMEDRMYDIYNTYQIPRDVPFERVASR